MSATAAALVRAIVEEYGVDLRVPGESRAYLADPRARVREIGSEGQYVDVLRRLLRREGVTGVDYRLVAPFWRDEALAPRRLAERWESWSAYWTATQVRPDIVGSCYNDRSAGVARAWRLGITAARYPRGLSHLLPERWRGGRERILALTVLSRRLRGAVIVDGAKTADLRRLAKLGGAFLRAIIGAWDSIFVGNRVNWYAVAIQHQRWVALPHARLRAARVPARLWLAEGMTAALRHGFLPTRGPGRPEEAERLRAFRSARAAAPGDPLANLAASRWRREEVLRVSVEPRAAAAALRPDVRRAAALGLPLPVVGLSERVLVRAHDIAIAAIRKIRLVRKRAHETADRYAPGAAKARVNAALAARHLARKEARLAQFAARRRAFRAADGALVGWRTWAIRGDMLESPSQSTLWAGAELVAQALVTSGGARDAPGIHASWSRRHGDYKAYAPRSGRWVIGRVRGYGRYVVGPEGWRAERVAIDRLIAGWAVSDREIAALAERYRVSVGRGRR